MREIQVNRDYQRFIEDLKTRVRKAQLRASLSVNKELVMLYWRIGKEIHERKQSLEWGAKIVQKLAKDLQGA